MDIGKGSKKGKWHILTDSRSAGRDWDGHHFGAGTMCKDYIKLEEFKRRVEVDGDDLSGFCSKCQRIIFKKHKGIKKPNASGL